MKPLIVQHSRPVFVAPPAPPAFTSEDKLGNVFTVVPRGDVFEVFGGGRTIYAFPVDTDTMFRMARWIVWTWWVKTTWCGLRTWWMRRQALRA